MPHDKVLVIGDTHCMPDVSNERMEALGRFVLQEQPDLIVHIGDWADMPSLSRFDVGSVRAEGRRYVDDIRSANDALVAFDRPIIEYNRRQARNKKRGYNPRKVITLGNHEHRIDRAANEQPALYGNLTINDIRFVEHGWEVYPFLEPFVYEDLTFMHFFPSGVMLRPISGDHHAANLVKKNLCSCICGHTHARDFWETRNARGEKLFGLVVGCFYDHAELFDTDTGRHWRGLVMLEKSTPASPWSPRWYDYEEVMELMQEE